MSDQLQRVLDKIDSRNAMDPNRVVQDGRETSKEILYSERMTERLHSFHQEPVDTLQIAARAQHIERWIIARKDYPMTREGYKSWRTNLAVHHSELTASLMKEEGYAEEKIDQTRELLTKKDLKTSPDVQALEDVICLVFLEHYFEDFAKSQSEEKIVSIVRKTWLKMSERAHQVALTINFSSATKSLVEKALG